jgi:hypothetical protein
MTGQFEAKVITFEFTSYMELKGFCANPMMIVFLGNRIRISPLP